MFGTMIPRRWEATISLDLSTKLPSVLKVWQMIGREILSGKQRDLNWNKLHL
eukprot:COSAG02_NODE_10576_length_1910_cov_1.431806_1_plen_52_part_00